MRQAIGTTSIEVYTREEAQKDLAVHHKELSNTLREQYRGVKAIKLPIAQGTATGTALAFPGNTQEPIFVGPQQGYFWRIGRVTVTSSGVDTGAVSLFVGSDPTATTSQFLIDNTLKVGQAYYPGSRGLFLRPGEQIYVSLVSVSGNVYRITGEAIEVPAEMAPRILGGGG